MSWPMIAEVRVFPFHSSAYPIQTTTIAIQWNDDLNKIIKNIALLILKGAPLEYDDVKVFCNGGADDITDELLKVKTFSKLPHYINDLSINVISRIAAKANSCGKL
jgi:hypothetical protein